MDYIINDEMLKNLVEKKKQHIGYSWLSAVSELGSSAGMIVTAITGDFSKRNIYFQPCVFTLGLVFLGIGIVQLWKNIGKDHYNHVKLLNDIIDLNKSENQYSLVAIANTYDDFPAKWLLRCDHDWKDTYLFLPYKTKGDNFKDDISNIRSTLERELKVEKTNIEVSMLIEKKNHRKYSPKYGRDKVYDHRFYQATINNFPDNLKKDYFEIDQKKYKWMTFEEMKLDANILKYNIDVVSIFETEARPSREKF